MKVIAATLAIIVETVVATSRLASSPTKFLIASAGSAGKVQYVEIANGGLTGSEVLTDLITTGLTSPQGLAVNSLGKKLFVADPDQGKILMYDLSYTHRGLGAGNPVSIVNDTEARWVACDNDGNVFFSDESANQILKLSFTGNGHNASSPEVIYDGASTPQVSSPGGIGVDSFYVYWVNKAQGTAAGSLVRALHSPDASDPAASVETLATNVDKSYGVCLALSNAFYTQPDKEVYGVKKGGSAPQLITDRLTNPRGCAWDGDGTVYVADRGVGALFTFGGNMQDLVGTSVSRSLDMEDAFGTAVFLASSWRSLPRLMGFVPFLVVALQGRLL